MISCAGCRSTFIRCIVSAKDEEHIISKLVFRPMLNTDELCESVCRHSSNNNHSFRYADFGPSRLNAPAYDRNQVDELFGM